MRDHGPVRQWMNILPPRIDVVGLQAMPERGPRVRQSWGITFEALVAHRRELCGAQSLKRRAAPMAPGQG